MRVAIVQDGPVINNKKETLEKTLAYIKEAAREKARIVVFGECWFSGYPAWLDVCEKAGLWDYTPVKTIWASMYENGLEKDSPELIEIRKMAKSCQLYVVLGANEPIRSGPGNGSLYNSIFTLSDKGEILNHHRKLIPTYTERLVHAQGDGFGLKSIPVDAYRIGSLICWEHWMPLTRQAMHDEAEDVHIALWPQVKEMNQIACRQYAFEGRCYVVAVGQLMLESEIPDGLNISDSAPASESGYIMRGGSSVFGPDGKIILEPLYDKKSLLIQDLEMSRLQQERMNLSVSGHYHRRDIFDLVIDKKRKII